MNSHFIDIKKVREHESETIANHSPFCVFWSAVPAYRDVAYLLEEDRECFYTTQVPAWHATKCKIRKMEEACVGNAFSEKQTDENGFWGLVVSKPGHEACPLAMSKGVMIMGISYWFKNKQDRDDVVIESQKYSRFCAVCAKPSTKKCVRCKAVRYCSKECQKTHWKKHKKVCV